MNDSLNSLTNVLEQCFGFSGELERMTGGLSHEVYSLSKENVIVKVYSREITSERLQAEAEALNLLSESRLVNSPQIIASNSGQYRVKFNSTFLSCFKKIEGQRKYLLTECPKDLFSIKSIGNYLGKLHKEFSQKASALKESKILEISKGLPGVASAEVEEILRSLSQFDAPHFITHGDFQQSNLLYLDEKISGVIDFEYSTNDFRINDLAGCLSNLLSASGSADSFIVTFTDGYEESFGKKLLPVERDLLQPIIRLIWHVNLFWAETTLKQNNSQDAVDLLEQYHAQTMRCLNN